MNVEVCIDNIESLFIAQKAGAGRIELCSSLALGGLTPAASLIQMAVKHSKIPVYSMIRPRDGDFFYSSFEIEMMLREIHIAKKSGVHGVVFGVLDKYANIDQVVLKSLTKEATGLGVTFHRAIDCCQNVESALEVIMNAGCERILSSGLASDALQGAETLNKMVKQVNGRLSIMAGAGVNASNVIDIINQSAVNEVHLSGKIEKASGIENIVNCGELAEFKHIHVTGFENIQAVVEQLS